MPADRPPYLSLAVPELAAPVHAAWERKAAFWDERMGDGNEFHHALVGPTVEGLLKVGAGETVLDVACGNGVFARRLADLGTHVVACDFAETFIQRAIDRERADGNQRDIDYRVVDATNERALLQLGEHRFDAAVCNMSLMDMVAVDPLFRALPALLKPGGRFVLTVMHPCFNQPGSRFIIEETTAGAPAAYALRVTNYLRNEPAEGVGMVGEPAPHYSFHRPLSDLLNAAFNAGLVMDGVAEPAFGDQSAGHKPFSWENYPAIPPVFAARFRPATRE
jgi:2-polyprenyl-3-methyl-5-hydroxy-6-metoxy-1,4-benzoquinol methylase